MDTILITEGPVQVPVEGLAQNIVYFPPRLLEAFSRTAHLASEEEVHVPGVYDSAAHTLNVFLHHLRLGLSRLDHCLVNPQVKRGNTEVQLPLL